ncbi:MAG TPA: hypothetical protein VFT75_18535 [Nocardioidaceae bacterium]|nr:hypothetical protein [Nocardioidaceae bacterium]
MRFNDGMLGWLLWMDGSYAVCVADDRPGAFSVRADQVWFA